MHLSHNTNIDWHLSLRSRWSNVRSALLIDATLIQHLVESDLILKILGFMIEFSLSLEHFIFSCSWTVIVVDVLLEIRLA